MLYHREGRIVELAVGRPKEECADAVAGSQQIDGANDFRRLPPLIQLRQVGMDLPVRAHFEEGHRQQMPHLSVMLQDPTAGREERRGDLVLDQEVDEWGVVPGSVSHRAEIEGQSYLVAGPCPPSNNLCWTLGNGGERRAHG